MGVRGIRDGVGCGGKCRPVVELAPRGSGERLSSAYPADHSLLGVPQVPPPPDRLALHDQTQIRRAVVEGSRDPEPVPAGQDLGDLDSTKEKPVTPAPEDEKERLSAIIQELNDLYGVGLTEEDRISLENLERRLVDYTALQAAAKSNTRGNVELTFEQKVNDYLQDMADSNFKLYKRINDDREFGAHLLSLLFEEFWRRNRVEADSDMGA